MKVLQIIDSLSTGGAEKLILDSLPLYRKAGIEMDLLVLKDDKYPFMEKLKQSSSCKIFILGNGSVYNPLHILKLVKKIPYYDIAHVHLFPAQYWVVLAKILSKAKTKLIFTEHSTSNRRIKNNLLAVVDRFFYKGYDKIITISEEVNDILKRHTKLSDDKFRIIYNGVNLEAIFTAHPLKRISLGLYDKDYLVLQVSSFRQQKNQITLIKALKHLPDHTKLILAGEGQHLKKCIDLTKALKLSDRVKFLGNRNDVPQLLKTADIIVLSSHYEGMSLSSIEGMASGRPFIASDVPGLTDMVKGAGLLFQHQNEKELAQHIINLKNDKAYYSKVAKACQNRAKLYNINTMINKQIEVYKALCQEN